MTFFTLMGVACRPGIEPVFSATTQESPMAKTTATVTGRPVPSPIYGVTVDTVENIDETIESLKHLTKPPTVRIVFDEGMMPGNYRPSLVQLQPHAFIMGEILDSSAVKEYTASGYVERTKNYFEVLKDVVDIWEIGNEINGEWLGDAQSVSNAAIDSYKFVKLNGGVTALTLYYNQGCYTNPDNEMFRWVDTNLPEEVRNGLDYVWISYYEEDCNDLKPDWHQVFKDLAAVFPHSKVGFGEVGTKNVADKAAYLSRYYGFRPSLPQYVGGGFWWYYLNDMVPYTKPLWSALNKAFSATP